MATVTVLADSNILIWYLRGFPDIINEAKKLVSNNLLYVTPVIIAEIISGARKKEEDIIKNMFASMRVINIDEKTGRTAGEYLNKYSKSHALEVPDALIAASAVHGKMKLWTLNKKHYPMLNKKDFYEF